jgi:rhodanese-related sulfurtransferase
MAVTVDKTSRLPVAATALAVLVRYGVGSIVATSPAPGADAVDELAWAGVTSFFVVLAAVVIGASSWPRRALLPILAAIVGLVLVLWATWGAHAVLIEAAGFALLILAAILEQRPRPALQTPAGDHAWIEVTDLVERLRAPVPPVVVDVRAPEEFVGELGHIEGAWNIPLGEILQHLHELERNKSETVVVVCKTQMRSAKAAAALTAAGFRDVAVLRGGMLEWVRQRHQTRDTHG